MIIDKYLETLPPDIILQGDFCVTLNGNKQPYDPFKKMLVSAKDKFYSFEELLSLDLDKYETLGVRANRHVSMIDIDNCIHSDGSISPTALDIINYMKSYTELSPSGTGIRILFTTKTLFDIKTHKTKNSKIGLEYYDGLDQENRGGRMCRLSANKIMSYSFREVDTQALLDKYMLRENFNSTHLTDEPIDSDWVDIVYLLITHRLDMKNLLNREFNLDESSSDLLIVNIIAEYTRNIAEIKAVFEKTNYYKSKGIRSNRKKHKDKWDGDYGWKTVSLANPKEIKLNKKEIGRKDCNVNKLIAVSLKHGLTKAYYFKTFHIDWDAIQFTEQEEIDCLYNLIIMKRNKLNVKEHLTEILKKNSV
jgi:hypothetical protein